MTILALHTMFLRRRTVWSGWKAVTLLLNTFNDITNGFVFELMKQCIDYRSMGYDVPCKMLALIVGTEISSTQIRSTNAKIVRIVKTADKLRGCKKEEYLKEIFITG